MPIYSCTKNQRPNCLFEVWGIILGHTASNWGNYTLNQQLPTYLSNVLRFVRSLITDVHHILRWQIEFVVQRLALLPVLPGSNVCMSGSLLAD